MNPGTKASSPMNQSALYQRDMPNSIPCILTFSPTYLYILTLAPPPPSSLDAPDMDRSVSTTKSYRPENQPIVFSYHLPPIPSPKSQKKKNKKEQKHTSAPNQIPSPRRAAIDPARIELPLRKEPPRRTRVHEREVRVQDPFPAALDGGGGAGGGGGGGG